VSDGIWVVSQIEPQPLRCLVGGHDLSPHAGQSARQAPSSWLWTGLTS
jgi:hypothetical protein